MNILKTSLINRKRRNKNYGAFNFYDNLVIVNERLFKVKSVVPLFLKSIVVVVVGVTTEDP